jgi:hypothetical protein
MVLSCLALLPVLLSSPDQAIKLERVFAKGQSLKYDIKSTINSEHREIGLQTWIPQDLDIQYQFTVQVLELKADGIADLKYLRPTMTEIEGETVDSPPKTKVEKLNTELLLTVSPANEILKLKDVTKKPGAKPAKPPLGFNRHTIMTREGQDALSAILGQFVGEIYRLSLFLGPLDSSLDFAPRLPFDDVKVGDTWKRTVGYSPQKLQGKGEKLAVQRLDYTYTYKGIVTSQNRQVHRIVADLEVKTDLAEFVHQTFNVKSEITGLKEIPLHFTGQLEFDLDLKTKHTLRAVGSSNGGFKVIVTQYPNDPVQEENFKGRTILKLLNP